MALSCSSDQHRNQQEEQQQRYDAEAKEAELRAEAAKWSPPQTGLPRAAEPWDVPVVDVSGWLKKKKRDSCEDDNENGKDELRRLSEQIREACEDNAGFFYLVGHGLPEEVTGCGGAAAGERGGGGRGGILGAAKDFHALPRHLKNRISMDRPDHPIGGVGYLGYNNRKLPSRETCNHNAAFVVKADHRIRLVEDNQWPPSPEEHGDDDGAPLLPGFRGAIERYVEEMTKLAKALLPLYAVALDLDGNYFDEAFEEPFYRLRLSHYPPPASASDDESPTTNASFGISPHVDTSFFTLLLTDGKPGLAIYSPKRDEWISVPPPPRDNADALIVNTGELLRQWSNDRFRSVPHYVRNNPTPAAADDDTTTAGAAKDRYSAAFFFNANSDYQMECLPTCRGPGNPPRYPPFSYNQSQASAQGE